MSEYGNETENESENENESEHESENENRNTSLPHHCCRRLLLPSLLRSPLPSLSPPSPTFLSLPLLVDFCPSRTIAVAVAVAVATIVAAAAFS